MEKANELIKRNSLVNASDLIKHLQSLVDKFGDQKVYLETEFNGRRSRQALHDILGNTEKILLTSKQATDADPLNQLPIISQGDKH